MQFQAPSRPAEIAAAVPSSEILRCAASPGPCWPRFESRGRVQTDEGPKALGWCGWSWLEGEETRSRIVESRRSNPAVLFTQHDIAHEVARLPVVCRRIGKPCLHHPGTRGQTGGAPGQRQGGAGQGA